MTSLPFKYLRKNDKLRLSPPALLVVFYMTAIVMGGILLYLPVSHHGKIDLGEALFTSTSAVTVTGLVLSDPGADFTAFGQAIILKNAVRLLSGAFAGPGDRLIRVLRTVFFRPRQALGAVLAPFP